MSSNPTAFRRRAGAASIVAFFVALLAATLLEPTDSHANVDQLRAAVAHPGLMQAAAWLEITAGVLAPVAVLTLMHVVRGRGARLAHIGGVLGVLGAVGMALIGVHRLFVVALAQQGGDRAGAVLDRLDHLAPAIIVLFFALPIAFVLLAVAGVRNGLAPRPVLAGAVVFLVIDMAPLPGAELIQLVLGLVTFGWLARRIGAMTDLEWAGANAVAPEPITGGRHAPAPA
jgi:hypothetical protein